MSFSLEADRQPTTPLRTLGLVANLGGMNGFFLLLLLPVALLAWGLGAAIYLPWWWKRFRGEEANLTRKETALMLGSFATFAAIIWVAVQGAG